MTIKTNHHLIQGGALSEAQKASIVRQLLAARSTPEEAQRFYRGVRFPGNLDSAGRRMYPAYYIPPYQEGKKLQTVIPLSPKTHILSANAYELELLRLLHLFAPERPGVREMVEGTLARLKTTCFGWQGCATGECFASGLIVLRFLAAAAPGETEWIKKLAAFFSQHYGDSTRRHGNVLWYYWLCLSELPMEIAGPEILRYETQILRQLGRSSVMNNESDKIHHPVMACMLRNCLCRFPAYAHLKGRQPYVGEKDGRLHFDLNPLLEG